MAKRKQGSKTEPLPKKLKGKSKKDALHRDASKVNQANCEVNAAGWSAVHNLKGTQMTDIIAFAKNASPNSKDKALEALQPLLDSLMHAHENSRKKAVASGKHLKTKATVCANTELTAVKRNNDNGHNPHMLRC